MSSAEMYLFPFENWVWNLLLWYWVVALLSWVWQRARAPGLELRGKHVLVTGGSSGLGLALAEECARRGASVSIVARNEAKLAQGLTRLRSAAGAAGGRCLSLVADVTVHEDIATAVNTATHEIGPIDMLVANAGYSHPARLEDMTPAQMERQVRVNLLGTMNTVHAALPEMKARREGKIVLVGTALSVTVCSGYSAYCASKWGVKGFGDALRHELVSDNVQVFHFLPSTMDTPGLKEEEKTKPPEAQAIEETFASLVTPEAAAATCLAGVAKGSFITIQSDPGLELSRWLVHPTVPRWNLLIEAAMLPLAAFVQWGVSLWLDSVVRKTRKNETTGQKGTHSKTK